MATKDGKIKGTVIEMEGKEEAIFIGGFSQLIVMQLVKTNYDNSVIMTPYHVFVNNRFYFVY